MIAHAAVCVIGISFVPEVFDVSLEIGAAVVAAFPSKIICAAVVAAVSVDHVAGAAATAAFACYAVS